jgi:hypothetical protein
MLCDPDCDKRASSGEFMTLLGFAPPGIASRFPLFMNFQELY